MCTMHLHSGYTHTHAHIENCTHTSELVVSPTEMAWVDGFVSSGFPGATETEK